MIPKLSKLGFFIALLTSTACVVVPDGDYGGGPVYYDGYYGGRPAYYDGYYDYAPVYPWGAGINFGVVDFGRGRGHHDRGGFSDHGRGGRRR